VTNIFEHVYMPTNRLKIESEQIAHHIANTWNTLKRLLLVVLQQHSLVTQSI